VTTRPPIEATFIPPVNYVKPPAAGRTLLAMIPERAELLKRDEPEATEATQS
jgi:hypothetical protein